MGKLRVLSGREVCKILEAEGFSEGAACALPVHELHSTHAE